MKKFFTAFLICFVIVAIAWVVVNPQQAADPPESMESIESATFQKPDPGPQTVVFYFHGEKRCRTCLQIESSTNAAIEESFSLELDSGDLELRSVNFDLKANQHYRDDFELTFGTVVVANYLDGEVLNYRNLEKVWDLVWDDAAFREYIEENTFAVLEGTTEG